MTIPNRKSVVKALAENYDLRAGKTDAERKRISHMFVRLVAQTLRKEDQNWGLLAKPHGNNYEGYKVDGLAYRDFNGGVCWLIDIISASESDEAAPAWQVQDKPEPLEDWRVPPPTKEPPVDPPVEPPTKPPTQPDPTPVNLAEVLTKLNHIEVVLQQLLLREFPDYEGKMWMGSLVLKPRK